MPFPRILARAASSVVLLLSVPFAAQADWNVAVGAASSNGAWSGANPDVWSPSASGATVAASEINSRLAAGTPVVINTSGGGAESGDITVNSTVTWAASELTLTAARNIAIKANLNGSGTAKLYLRYGFGTGTGGYTLGNGAKVNLPAGGNFSTQLNSTGLVAHTVIIALGAAGDATVAPVTMSLQGMRTGLAGNYVLGANIDASGTSTWNGNAGFTPVGTDAGTSFTGIFDGLGHTITGLTINRPTNVAANNYQGLFGYTAAGSTLRNVGLLNSSIYGASVVGTLAGRSDGTVSYAYADGGSATVSIHQAGGLVGGLGGSISYSYANVSVTGTNNSCCGGGVASTGMGGLVGNTSAGSSISNSYSTGSVNGGVAVGGLVGQNRANITNSYATGAVTATGADFGGLIGDQLGGTITSSYWDKVTTNQATSPGSAAADGKTTAEMKQLATFAAWDIDDAAGTGKVWRIYDTHTYPLLRSFLTALTVTANNATTTYSGAAYSGGNGVSYSTAPNANLLGTASYGGSSQGAVNLGNYVITPSGLYANQKGYDISYVSGTLSIVPASTNADLSMLKLTSISMTVAAPANIPLTPAFSTATTQYGATAGAGVTSITATPTLADGNATIKINGTTVANGNITAPIPLNSGMTTVTAVVTAQDGSTKKTYTVSVTPANAYGAQIQTMYIAYFGRPADPGGLAYYADLMNRRGGDNAVMMDDFWNSAESHGLYTQSAFSDKITQIYENLFGRPAETSGVSYWSNQVATGRITLPSVAYTVAYNAQAADAAILEKKRSAAQAFMAALDTPDKVARYLRNVAPGRVWLDAVVDDATLAAALAKIGAVVAGL